MSLTINKSKTLKLPVSTSKQRTSIEFFHIYTDETINESHAESIDHLRTIQENGAAGDLIVLIDNYNPTQETLSPKDVIKYLESRNIDTFYWAYEGDLVKSAELFLSELTNRKLKKQIKRYIEKNQKYPCSLLTATWYLTRLGNFDMTIIKSNQNKPYTASDMLVNILPLAYQGVEERARELIEKSNFKDQLIAIQNVYYKAQTHRKDNLF